MIILSQNWIGYHVKHDQGARSCIDAYYIRHRGIVKHTNVHV